jgi:hypothetical protein
MPAGGLPVAIIVEAVDGLDLSRLEQAYGAGAAQHTIRHCCCACWFMARHGVFSSGKIERVTFDSVAFRFVAAGSHPNHDTLATFRRRFLDELTGIFVQVLELAQEMSLLKLGQRFHLWIGGIMGVGTVRQRQLGNYQWPPACLRSGELCYKRRWLTSHPEAVG